MFDVVMPTYNSNPTYLREAIDSVFNQTYDGWHLYVVDGTPDDGHYPKAIEVLRDFDQKKWTLLEQTGKGVAQARNQAIAAGSSPFVAFLDGDDIWADQWLQFASQTLSEHTPKMMWAGSNMDISITSGKGNTYSMTVVGGLLSNWEETKPEHRWLRIRMNVITTASIVIDRTIFETHQFREGNNFFEDTELWTSIVKDYADEVHQENVTVAMYREHPDQATALGVSATLTKEEYDAGKAQLDELLEPENVERLARECAREDYPDEYYQQLLHSMFTADGRFAKGQVIHTNDTGRHS